MAESLDDQVRRYLLEKLPGPVDGKDVAECWRKSWADSGLQCSVTDWEIVLTRFGLTVQQVRDCRNGSPAVYRLAMPAPATNF